MGMTIDEAISHLDTYSSTMGSGQTTQEQHEDAKRVAIATMRKYQKLEQEPTTKNDLGVDVLDKIRGEIETKYGRCKLVEYIVQYDGICTRRNEMGDIADILQIIDKYKTESEG